MRTVLLVALGVLAVLFVVTWAIAARARRDVAWPSPLQLAIGAGTNFFDTLGIGSLATTTTLFRALRVVPDERLPGTMIVGHTLAVTVQALIFITVVRIDTTLLVSMIAVAVVGGWIGGRVVCRLPRRPIQAGMGVALLVAALFMLLGQAELMPVGGTALALPMGRLAVALAVNVVLGALVMLGVGNYGPTFVLLSVLGMDPRAAFPVMMGSGAFAALVGGMAFIRSGAFDMRPALGLALGGIPAVLVAALLVKSLPLDVMRWMVIVVVVYAAATMLRASLRGADAVGAPTPAPEPT